MTRGRIHLGLLALATALAVAYNPLLVWAHRFPSVRTVVVQVEPCSVALLVGWRPASGDTTALLLGEAKVRGSDKDKEIQVLTQQLTAMAMSSLQLVMDDSPLVPTSVEAKVSVEDGTGRPVVLLLLSYAVTTGGKLALLSKEPKSTRISWVDKSNGRVEITSSPSQLQWHDDLASFLLTLSVSIPTEETSCQSSLANPSHLHSSEQLLPALPVVTKNTKKTTRAIPRRLKSTSSRQVVAPSSTK
jgi:hypothetical protein